VLAIVLLHQETLGFH